MKLKPGAPVVGRSDILTAEQVAWWAAHQCENGTMIHPEYRGGVLTPNGAFTFDTSIIERAPATEAEIDGAITAGTDLAHPSGGFVIAIGTEGQREYLGCLPTQEVFDLLTADQKAAIGDCEKELLGAKEVATEREAIVPAHPSEYLEPEVAPVVEAAPAVTAEVTHDGTGFSVTVEHPPEVVGSIAPAVEEPAAPVAPAIPTTDVPFPHDPASAHAIDSHDAGTTVTKTSANGYSVDKPGAFTDGNNIATGDALAHLPVGAQVVIGEAGPTKAMVVLPATDTRAAVVTFGSRFHEALAQVWAWLVTEGHAVVTAVEKL